MSSDIAQNANVQHYLSEFSRFDSSLPTGQVVRECRICFSSESQGDILVNPCNCRGTMSFVHEKCLVRWLTERNIYRCELCKQPIRVARIFSFKKLIQIIHRDFRFLLCNRDRAVRLTVSILCMTIYLRHFLPIVRFLRTKMLRNLCTLWMLFEQEEKMRQAYSFSWQMKAEQIILKEIPITIKLMVFMWILRKFVGFGAKYILNLFRFIHSRYMQARELKIEQYTNVSNAERAQHRIRDGNIRGPILSNQGMFDGLLAQSIIAPISQGDQSDAETNHYSWRQDFYGTIYFAGIQFGDDN